MDINKKFLGYVEYADGGPTYFGKEVSLMRYIGGFLKRKQRLISYSKEVILHNAYPLPS